MKKIIVMAIAILTMAGAAMAAGTGTVAVNATVVGSCSVVAGSVTFGNLDAGGEGLVTGTVTQPTVTCANGLNYTVTDDDGLNELAANGNRMVNGGINFIQYSFTYTAGGTGTGGAVPMNIAASVAQADYLGKPVGAYADTVTLTVTP